MERRDTVRVVLERKGGTLYHVAPETPVYEALETMAAYDIGALLVVSGAHLVGVFSERDYARKIILHGRDSRETSVSEVMTMSPVTVHPNLTVDHCLQLMTKFRFRHLPVMEEGALLGVLSIGDLVNWTIESQDEEIHHLNRYITGSYPV